MTVSTAATLHEVAQELLDAAEQIIATTSGGPVALKIENTVAEGRGFLWNGVLEPRSLSAIPLSAYEVVDRGWGGP